MESNNCYTCPHKKGQNMINYHLWYLSKYHGLNLSGDLSGDLIDPMDFKNPNIRYPKKEKKDR